MAVTKRKFTVILEMEADGGYSVYCPALPGCVSQGDSRDEALENIQEAILLVWETLATDEMVGERVAENFDNQGTAPPYEDSPEIVAEEIGHILKGRHEDGLPLAGLSTEMVEVELPVGAPA